MNRHVDYKDSGVEWIGKIPENWRIKKVKYVARVNQLALSEDTEETYEFNYIDIGNVDLEKGYSITEKVNFKNAPSRARRIVRKGDTIVSTVRTYLKAIAHFGGDADDFIVSTGFSVVTPGSQLESKFIYYILRSERIIDRICALSVGVSYPAINSSDLADIAIWYPGNISEQRHISAFLDRKTAQIDDLIVRKERVIDLLKEERMAIINQAVTKGLDPKAEMKDSGIEWLGKVPRHWEIKRLKYVGEAIIGLTYSPDEISPTGTLVLRASNIQDGKIDLDDSVYVSKEIPKKLIVREGDILICSRSGSRALIGKCIYIDKKQAGNSFGTFMTVFRGKSNRFVYYVFNSTIFTSHIGSFLTSTINQLTTENLNGIIIALPPSKEQMAIAEFLVNKTIQIDAQIDREEQLIELLKEYRTALISEAVTGKIDVRG